MNCGDNEAPRRNSEEADCQATLPRNAPAPPTKAGLRGPLAPYFRTHSDEFFATGWRGNISLSRAHSRIGQMSGRRDAPRQPPRPLAPPHYVPV